MCFFTLIYGCTFFAVVWWKIRLPSYIFTVLGKTCAKYLLSWDGPLAGETRRNGSGSNTLPPGTLFVWGRPRDVSRETTTEWNVTALWKGVQRRGDNILLQVRIEGMLLWMLPCEVMKQVDLIKLVALLTSCCLYHGRSLFFWSKYHHQFSNQWKKQAKLCVKAGSSRGNEKGNGKDANDTESHWLERLNDGVW